MIEIKRYKKEIFEISNKEEFQKLSLEAFDYQRANCKVYREYLEGIGKLNVNPCSITEIPFLPIKLFKNCKIVSSAISSKGSEDIDISDYKLFTSSATTSMIPSKHYVKDLNLYEKSFTEGFIHFYGELKNYNLLALLPSYLEREGSSLVYMADKLIEKIKNSGGEGGFYLYNHNELLDKIISLTPQSTQTLEKNRDLSPFTKRETILLGVSFALLDFGEFIQNIADESLKKEALAATKNIIIIETGGMKGRGKELSRNELHTALKNMYQTSAIHSEYGMAELLSQAYLQNGEKFFSPPWLKILVRDLYNPFKISTLGSGAINIIDLANIDSCCFIESEDMGNIYNDDSFTIEGRCSNSELRGCNMLLE